MSIKPIPTGIYGNFTDWYNDLDVGQTGVHIGSVGLPGRFSYRSYYELNTTDFHGATTGTPCPDTVGHSCLIFLDYLKNKELLINGSGGVPLYIPESGSHWSFITQEAAMPGLGLLSKTGYTINPSPNDLTPIPTGDYYLCNEIQTSGNYQTLVFDKSIYNSWDADRLTFEIPFSGLFMPQNEFRFYFKSNQENYLSYKRLSNSDIYGSGGYHLSLYLNDAEVDTMLLNSPCSGDYDHSNAKNLIVGFRKRNDARDVPADYMFWSLGNAKYVYLRPSGEGYIGSCTQLFAQNIGEDGVYEYYDSLSYYNQLRYTTETDLTDGYFAIGNGGGPSSGNIYYRGMAIIRDCSYFYNVTHAGDSPTLNYPSLYGPSGTNYHHIYRESGISLSDCYYNVPCGLCDDGEVESITLTMAGHTKLQFLNRSITCNRNCKEQVNYLGSVRQTGIEIDYGIEDKYCCTYKGSILKIPYGEMDLQQISCNGDDTDIVCAPYYVDIYATITLSQPYSSGEVCLECPTPSQQLRRGLTSDLIDITVSVDVEMYAEGPNAYCNTPSGIAYSCEASIPLPCVKELYGKCNGVNIGIPTYNKSVGFTIPFKHFCDGNKSESRHTFTYRPDGAYAGDFFTGFGCIAKTDKIVWSIQK